MTKDILLQAKVPEEMAGMRLDLALAQLFPQHSRSRLQDWLKQGSVLVNTASHLRAKDKVKGGELISIQTMQMPTPQWIAENIPLEIVFEDEEILVINKPVGLVVHPAIGNHTGTLVNALLHYAPSLADLPRAGIVHRLDKNTSGLLIVAKTATSHTYLIRQMQKRKIHREYLAVVLGVMTSGSTISAPIGRDPHHRTKMAVIPQGRKATTHYRVLERFRAHTLVQAILETGRTHQIRVHMEYIRFPVVGDPTYGGRLRIPQKADPVLKQLLQQFHHQALHAKSLSLQHPVTQEVLNFEATIPEDMQQLISALRQDQEKNSK